MESCDYSPDAFRIGDRVIVTGYDGCLSHGGQLATMVKSQLAGMPLKYLVLDKECNHRIKVITDRFEHFKSYNLWSRNTPPRPVFPQPWQRPSDGATDKFFAVEKRFLVLSGSVQTIADIDVIIEKLSQLRKCIEWEAVYGEREEK
jgi:hypothetical protein